MKRMFNDEACSISYSVEGISNEALKEIFGREPISIFSKDISELIAEDPKTGEKAEFVPLRRGRWVDEDSNGGVKCSICNHYTLFYRGNYCPLCGAKMDLEEQED